jgi:hypothetical protein
MVVDSGARMGRSKAELLLKGYGRRCGKHHLADWIKFADGMSVKLGCDRRSLDAWWHSVST